MPDKKRLYTRDESERAMREARMHAEFPQHRAHGMYGDPTLDNKKKKSSQVDPSEIKN